VFDKLGVHAAFDRVGDGVLLLAILTCIVFAVIAVVQLVRYHSIDRSLLWMFVMYLLVAAIYVAFNFFEVNYRPTLDEGMLEASFPSSHVMAVCLVMGTAAIAVHDLVESHGVFVLVTLVAIVAMLAIMATRLLAGVHWFTDVTAGFLFAMVLVSLYGTIMSRKPVVTGKHAR
jgi:undecaprenyl-diphosphatase